MAFSCPLHNWHDQYYPCPLCYHTITTATPINVENAELSIKEDCELQYKKIKYAEERLKDLRRICNHEKTFEGLYSYRIGNVQPAIICSDCGSLIKYLIKSDIK